MADGSLTGADVNEGSLGQVPRAANAGSAGSANTANDANQLAGRDSTDFGSGLVMGRINGLDEYSSGVKHASPSGVSSVGSGNFTHFTGMLTPSTSTVVRDLSVEVTAPVSAGDLRIFEIYDDGNETNVECVVSAGASTCNSGSASAVVSPGSRLTLGTSVSDGGGGVTSASAMHGFRVTLP